MALPATSSAGGRGSSKPAKSPLGPPQRAFSCLADAPPAFAEGFSKPETAGAPLWCGMGCNPSLTRLWQGRIVPTPARCPAEDHSMEPVMTGRTRTAWPIQDHHPGSRRRRAAPLRHHGRGLAAVVSFARKAVLDGS